MGVLVCCKYTFPRDRWGKYLHPLSFLLNFFRFKTCICFSETVCHFLFSLLSIPLAILFSLLPCSLDFAYLSINPSLSFIFCPLSLFFLFSSLFRFLSVVFIQRRSLFLLCRPSPSSEQPWTPTWSWRQMTSLMLCMVRSWMSSLAAQGTCIKCSPETNPQEGLVDRWKSCGSDVPATRHTEEPCQKPSYAVPCARIRFPQWDNRCDIAWIMQSDGFIDGTCACRTTVPEGGERTLKDDGIGWVSPLERSTAAQDRRVTISD